MAHLENSFAKLNEAQLILHHAIQFIAISGKYLTEEKEDDSHTNMEWDSEKNSFLGGLINNRARVGFHAPSFTLKVLGPTGIELASLSLTGRTKSETLTWLKQALLLKQINSDALKSDVHYEIPPHEVDKDKPFPKVDKKLLTELAEHRTLAHKVSEEIASSFDTSTPVRTWPHHFDHGVYIPFKFDDENEALQSFSVGYAVADSVIEEPYFYVTQWKKDEEVNYSLAPELKTGTWYPKELKGAALRFSEIEKEGINSISVINSFVEEAINWSLKV